jgi:septation ring formation regulator EzrA
MNNEEFQRLVLKSLQEINERLDGVDERFNSVDERFSSIDERFNSIDERFNKIDAKLSEHDLQFASIRGELADLRNLSTQHHEELENVARRVQKSLQTTEKLLEIDNEYLAKRSLLKRID